MRPDADESWADPTRPSSPTRADHRSAIPGTSPIVMGDHKHICWTRPRWRGVGTHQRHLGRRALIILALSRSSRARSCAALGAEMPVAGSARGLTGAREGRHHATRANVISDVVTPSEHAAQYQGSSAAVGRSRIGGPIIGGVLPKNLCLSMIFGINVPSALARWRC